MKYQTKTVPGLTLLAGQRCPCAATYRRWMRLFITAFVLFLGTSAAHAEEIGSVSTVFKLLGPNDKIVILEGGSRFIGQVMEVRITEASQTTLYGDPAIHNLN